MTEQEIKDILDTVSADGSSGYKAEKGRYHLYVGHGCPFAFRTTVARVLKGLEDTITVDVVDPIKKDLDKGWNFSPEKANCTADTVCGKMYLRDVYMLSHPNYTGKISVPVLFDKNTKKIVSTDSAAILRMINNEFNEFCATEEQAKLDLYPKEKRDEIEELKKWIIPSVVFNVYAVALAKTQEVYDEKVTNLFNNLDKIDTILAQKRFLTGSNITEIDVFLFATLLRFDPVYYSLFKCNKKMMMDYPNIWPYLRDLFQTGDIASTVNFEHIKAIYYGSYKEFNPSLIIPAGPVIDFTEETDRAEIGKN
ncbi:glutathionyl-hydroquinone reductase YqjG-like [Hydractinia symbiolongicarpus]|uniref:glutathionyl-hydroquinone reductase YqjG-like n=1 Tax=Hydractinia symbiolongicarpus TaxID=13093 RepID=UPI00254FE67A|nr:glutathionyl-hydroquinone reductase YqjG-like [Hydractinia symbiolongicarpus]